MNTISAGISVQFPPQGFGQAKLSDEQKSAVSDILSQYDAETLSEEDVASIREQFREAGVRPSPELKSAIEEAGFDAEAFRPDGPPPGGPGGAGGPRQGPPPGTGDEDSDETLKTIASIFEDYDLESLSEEDLNEIQQKLQEAGIALPGSVIDQSA